MWTLAPESAKLSSSPALAACPWPPPGGPVACLPNCGRELSACQARRTGRARECEIVCGLPFSCPGHWVGKKSGRKEGEKKGRGRAEPGIPGAPTPGLRGLEPLRPAPPVGAAHRPGLRGRGARAGGQVCPPRALVEGKPSRSTPVSVNPVCTWHLNNRNSHLWNLCHAFIQPSQILSGYLCPGTELRRWVGKCLCGRRALWS